MRGDLLDKITDARDALMQLDKLAEDEARFALAHCVKALRIAKDADGLTPTRRQQCRSAYRMGCAALGVDHD